MKYTIYSLSRLAGFCLLLFVFSLSLRAEEPTGKRPFGYEPGDSVEVSLGSGTLSSPYVPFDVGFRLVGDITEDIVEVRAYYSVVTSDSMPCNCNCGETGNKVDTVSAPCGCGTPKSCTPLCPWKRNLLPTTRFSIYVPPLPANRHYRFCFKVIRKADSAETVIISGILSGILMRALERTMTSQLQTTENIDKGVLWSTFVQHQIQPVRDSFSRDVKLFFTRKYGITDESMLTEMSRLPMLDSVNAGNGYAELRDLLEKTNALSPLVDRRLKFRAYQNMGGKKINICDSLNRINSLPFVTTLNNDNKFKGSEKLKQQLKALSAVLSTPTSRDSINQGRQTFLKTSGQPIVFKAELKITPEDIDGEVSNYTLSIAFLQEVLNNLDAFLVTNSTLIRTSKLDPEPFRKEISLAIARFQSQIKSLEALKEAVLAKSGLSDRIAERLILINDIGIRLPVGGITSGDFMTRNQWYITADAGFLFAVYNFQSSFQNNTALLPYYGINFNFAPINRNADYSLFGRKCNRYGRCYSALWKNMSGVVGFTALSAANADRENTWSDQNYSLVTGVGLRLTSSIRFSTGAIWTQQHRMNPLSGSSQLRASLYFSLSLDLDLLKYTRNAGQIIFH